MAIYMKTNKYDKPLMLIVILYFVFCLFTYLFHFPTVSTNLPVIALTMMLLGKYAKGTNIQLEIYLPCFIFLYSLVGGYFI